MMANMPERYISIFFLQPSKLVYVLTKIVNKSQPTLYNGVNIPYASREKRRPKMQYPEISVPHNNGGISDLAFFNNMRKNLEEVP
jgi:hypothetical protein